MATEKRLIDANAFRRRIEAFVATVRYKGIKNVPTGYETSIPTEYMRGYERGVMDTYTVAVEQPEVDAVEVVHGRWLYDSGSGKYFCSACDEFALESFGGLSPSNYCPHCGAKMGW